MRHRIRTKYSKCATSTNPSINSVEWVSQLMLRCARNGKLVSYMSSARTPSMSDAWGSQATMEPAFEFWLCDDAIIESLDAARNKQLSCPAGYKVVSGVCVRSSTRTERAVRFEAFVVQP